MTMDPHQLPAPMSKDPHLAQDNDYATWKAYQNRFWPAQYVLDTKGHIRMVHAGEGAYEEIEMAVKMLGKLAIRKPAQVRG